MVYYLAYDMDKTTIKNECKVRYRDETSYRCRWIVAFTDDLEENRIYKKLFIYILKSTTVTK